ncbi:MAG: DUF2202 domain-containing protein [Chloroflexi bacterium]|nr:DUF2202 domain-containing protein [Chloroflexota bacterium]
MNKFTKWVLGAGLVIALGVAACAPMPTTAQSVASPVAPVNASAPVGALSASEADALAFMREEEKLAHDVYVALYAKWQLPVFQNIANSEQTHTDAIKTLLERYSVADPAAGKAVGVFANATLQGLYDQLVKQAGQSLADALRVGALIEEIDIQDLQTRIAQTDKADIKLVYANLMRGSRNHLRSFTAQLKAQTGATYAPQQLTQAEYAAIIAGTTETGRGASNAQGNGFRGGQR